MASSTINQPQRRLGTRVRAQIPVRITSVAGEKFSLSCHTLMVNPQGCGVRSPRPLTKGTQLRIEDLPGRGITAATVACTRPLEEGSKYWIVGIALKRQATCGAWPRCPKIGEPIPPRQNSFQCR